MKLLQMVLLSLVFASSLTSSLSYADSKHASLYSELGERSGISQLMETFILNIAEDERIIHHFANVDIARFHTMLTDHICELAGGPCVYKGDKMVEVHTGMNVSRAEFNALVEDLIIAMEQEQVPVGAQNRLLAILASLHKEVIQL